jgi:hypothetical protein
MKAVETSIGFNPGFPYPPGLYRSVWDLICNTLFVEAPIGLETEGLIPDVTVWYEEVITCTSDEYPYSFKIMLSSGDVIPKPSDIIFFKRNFYIIGSVSQTADPSGLEYDCTGCTRMEMSVLGVYSELVNLSRVMTESENGRVSAEEGRVLAEGTRESNEEARQRGEASRNLAFAESQEQRAAAFSQEQTDRAIAFAAEKASREEYIRTLFAPRVVPGVVLIDITTDEKVFISDDEHDTPGEARQLFQQGYRVHLTIPGGKREEIIADSGEALLTLSGWKWNY